MEELKHNPLWAPSRETQNDFKADLESLCLWTAEPPEIWESGKKKLGTTTSVLQIEIIF